MSTSQEAPVPPARACPRALQSPKGDFSPNFVYSGLPPSLGFALHEDLGRGHGTRQEVQ